MSFKPKTTGAFLLHVGSLALLAQFSSVEAQNNGTKVFINEFHYDNKAPVEDEDEFIEIAGPAGTDLTGWMLALYDGDGSGDNTDTGEMYRNITLSGSIPNQQSGFGTLAFELESIQNGGGPNFPGPDGICLVDASGNVVQFLSYEGGTTDVIIATNGPCINTVSVDIGVSEDPQDGDVSLQLRGTGSVYEDFSWFATPYPQSFFYINAGQNFPSLSAATKSIEEQIAELKVLTDGRFDDVDEALDELQQSLDSINNTVVEECASSTGKSTKKSSKGSSSRLGSGKGKGKGRSSRSGI